MAAAKRKTTSRTIMELDDILERVTRAEEQVRAAAARHEERHHESVEFMKRSVESMRNVDERINSLEKALAKYTGFWGAIVLVTSAIATTIMLLREFFAHKFGLGE